MDIAILHYHLRLGGVARVIDLAQRALEQRGHRVLVIVGEAAPGAQVVPELAYGEPACREAGLRHGVLGLCRRRWGREPDALVIHNHALGKNGALPAAVAAWSREGRAMVLQLHDFAENGRPANYALLRRELGPGLARLYPSGGGAKLVVLTRRAAERLRAAGAQAEVLPNPVVAPAVSDPIRPSALHADRVVVYPTRAIRRKNLGEFLLHAMGARRGEVFLVTSSPQSGADAALCAAWKEWARRRRLPVVWEACERLGASLGDVLAGATLALTTSVEEGFGMAFVEPLAAGVGVAGRDLPEVTADLVEMGLPLGGLYRSCPVPKESFDFAAFQERVRRQVLAASEAYGVAAEESGLWAALEGLASGGQVDFGRLDEVAQREVLEQGAAPPALQAPDPSHLAMAQRVLSTTFGLGAYGRRLENLCEAAAAEAHGPAIYADAAALLAGFLRWQDFSALRFGLPAEEFLLPPRGSPL